MKKKLLKTATVVAKVDPRKPLPPPMPTRTRVQPTKAKLVAALKKLHPMD